MSNQISSLIFTVFALSSVGFSQNLIQNSGFENDLASWSSLWTRSGDSGSVAIVSSPIHSGAKAAHLSYTGHQDYSFSPQSRSGVKEGQIYEYTAWVRVDSMTRSCQLSASLYDANSQAIDWSWGEKEFSKTNGAFVRFSSRFAIPAGAATIMPRFIGSDGPVDIYIDDVAFTLVDSIANPQKTFTLQNQALAAAVHAGSWQIDLTDRQTGTVFSTGKNYQFAITAVDSFADSLRFHCFYFRDSLPVVIALWLRDNTACFSLRADSNAAISGPIDFPGLIASRTSDYLIIPKGTGVLWPATRQFEAPLWGGYRMYDWSIGISLAGVTDLQSGYALVAGDPWDTQIEFVKPSGSTAYAPQLRLLPAKDRFGCERTFAVAVCGSGGYVSLAKSYRAHAERMGYVKTFAAKIAANATIDRLRGAMDFWFTGRGFWFSNASFFRRMIDYGFDRAVFSGGMSNAVIDTVNSLAFLTSEYDCYCDAYPPGHAGYDSDGYNTGAIVQKDGSYMNGWLAYLDSGQTLQAQEVCSAVHCRYAIPRVTTARQSRRLNCLFIDVELAMGLQECWSPVHPVSRRSDAAWRAKLFDTLRTTFGLVLGGEQARDFAFPYVDYGEGTMSLASAENAGYDWSTPVRSTDSLKEFLLLSMDPAVRIPLHGLIYHDVHVPTWYTGDGASKTPDWWDDKDLFNILYASMPLLMPPDTGYWSARFDRFLETIHGAGGVFREAGFSPMTGHSFRSADRKVQTTTFANGWNVTTNFAAAPVTVDNRELAAKGYYASNSTYEIFKLQNGGTQLSVSRCADRLYVNPRSLTATVAGVRSAGTVYLKKETDYIHLALIGPQTSVDIKPDSLPWPVSAAKIYTKDRSKEITPAAIANGWLSVPKSGTERFYRIEGAFLKEHHPVVHQAMQTPLRIICRKNALIFSFAGPAAPTVRIYALSGALVLKTDFSRQGNTAGSFRQDIGSLRCGPYIAEITCSGKTFVQTILVARH